MAMTIMDDYLESPMDSDDVFPCKGCGEILEEGKAFELAGNRWHLDCFRCNTCNSLLDSDANLLLLGDGSLICNNCTYSCSACSNKIEDLAILTGDQAFCATCFRCRNCKRKIENLRYARTSQGIFCMSCHESLMTRRRKRSKAAAHAKREKDASLMTTEKSLPALPPAAIPPNAFSNDRVLPNDGPLTELSPRPRQAYSGNDPSRTLRTDRSRERLVDPSRRDSSGLVPPQTSYRKHRNSSVVSADFNETEEDGFFIPVALDSHQSPSVSLTPKSATEKISDKGRRSKEKEYFSNKKMDSSTPTPHIAFQEKVRTPSSEYEINAQDRASRTLSKRARNGQSGLIACERLSNGHANGSEDFKLQEAPQSKKLLYSRTTSIQSGTTCESDSSKTTNGIYHKDRASKSNSLPSLGATENMNSARSSQESRNRDEAEVRSSVESISGQSDGSVSKSIARKELPPSVSRIINGKLMSTTSDDTVSRSQTATPRPAPPNVKPSTTYMQPRAPPQPPAQVGKDASTESKESAHLPIWSAGGDFSMDEDMARILGTDEGSSSIMRRVSNAVRHGRTNSVESSTSLGRYGHNRSSNDSGATLDDPAFLKRQLRTSEQRVAELERQVNTDSELKNLNKKLQEKRKTVSVLDSQTEIMIRQLEVLAGYVERAKKTNDSLDTRELEESAMKEFVKKLDKLKQGLATQIEQLHAERDELLEDKRHVMEDRDRALSEFEQLSSKNAQLADMNNDLTQQIQERFKQQITHNPDVKSPNEHGIYGHTKGTSSVNLDASSLQTSASLVGTEGEEPVMEGAVVNMRKAQPRKFNWKKGASKVGHNFSKGINRAAVAFQQQDQPRGQANQAPTSESIGLPYNMTVAQVESPSQAGLGGPNAQQNRLPNENSRQGFGLFGGGGKKGQVGQKSTSTTVINTAQAAEAPSTLFGSELVERAEYERRQIPSVVTRCIEEVELRGMDIEGIYRKTGGNSQIKMIQEGFNKSNDYDISDPGLDITAVTSVLKQYFRKLPTPLLSFDIYEHILDSNGIQNVPERCSHLRRTIHMLPQKHRDCLEFLMFHLARVASREGENLMSPKNLAVVFAPTIMRDHSLEKEMTDMHAKNIAVQFIIENSHTIFGEA